ncbi:muscle M-line assembly protein unc-89 isoform X1 [Oreochromis niloticus]|uniref:muscle M-line assembly protein unc-89 isoform X1 n=1 Tax=Oreochromis niloticus TaxID=8128 RepID=UPI000DF336E2|nr:muscle M-line assembly protein unc-89 isoform X1 [Oreochromis niloticus]
MTLKDLHLTDSGVYTCTVCNKDGHMLLQKSVTLSVRVLQVEMVEVTQGEKSVLLPFRIKDDLPVDVTLLWRHENVTVHTYQRGQYQPDIQGHTEMKKDPLTTKDLSLTLKDLHLTDSGVYTCTIYNKDGHMLLQKAVILSVREYQLEMVEVTQGKEFVLLPFKIKEGFTQDVKVEWKHKNKMVHEYQIGKDQCHLKGQDQKQRTEMKKDPLNTKDLSLTLKDLHLTDSGVYTCTVYNKDGHMLLQKSVTLSVREYQLEMVEVTQGKEFVLLPFKIKEGFTQDVKVEWKHKNKMVHEYQIGKDQCHLKGQDQKQRTEMKKDPLNTKDLSLTLKDLHLTDSGVYTCTVYNKDGHMLLQKSVTLSVRVPEVQMVETVKGVQSVLLPFTTDIKLQDVTAEWKHEDKKVHVYQRDQNQSYIQSRTEVKNEQIKNGDLSLTLKDLHLTDSGVYTCTVYNKDGHMLLQKSVTLSVREYQLEMVEVTQGKEFVLLPFKIKEGFTQDVKVEWKHKNKMVHEYQIGKDQCHLKGQDQKQRTEMKKDPLNTKDLSLTLKDLHLTDSGVFTCTVYNKDGYMLLRKSVTLSVRVPEVQMVETVKGVQSVLLPFTTDIKLQDVTAEWKHEDKKVHVYQGDQNQSYIQSRTEVKNEQIKNGDLSLTLKDLHLTDSGVYTCTVYNKDGHMLLQKSVTLSVKEYQLEMVEVTQGKEFVLLPFKIKEGFTQDVKVEWKHKNKMVHEYQIGKDQCHLKGQDQKQRTEMKKDPLNTKDLSLTLKDLHLTDSGVYTCTVYNKDGHMLLRKSVTLSVRVPEVQMVETVKGVQSVLLPFTTDIKLQDVTVEWKHEDKKVPQGRAEMKKDPLRTGDFSLTLKDLHLTDSGVYTCTVYNKDGHMLLQKSVTLSVKVLQVEMVEVTQGEKSVLLPFRIKDDLPVDVTLMWRRENVTVHTYQRGQSQSHIQGRTEMNKDPLTTKDLSLTLKDLHLTDSGVYTCTVYNKDGHMLLQKSVTLSVRGDNKTTTTQAAKNQHTKKSTGRLTSSTERKK